MTLKKDRDEVEIVRTPGSRGGEKEWGDEESQIIKKTKMKGKTAKIEVAGTGRPQALVGARYVRCSVPNKSVSRPTNKMDISRLGSKCAYRLI
jgi:hypothetical protein